MTTARDEDIYREVRRQYGRIAKGGDTGCCGASAACCGTPADGTGTLSRALGYTAEEVGVVPDGANLGLGCGNPQVIAGLRPGEVVLDLGSGAGFDCFLASRQVGDSGRVIGVDMTPEMIDKARENARREAYRNVEFRLGRIESLPVADASVDVVISNCVVNLSPDKAGVFEEVFRVLKPGGRVAVSDVVARAELPASIRQDMALHTGCMAGASTVTDLEAMLRASGFEAIRVVPRDESRNFMREWVPGTDITDHLVSATIEAIRPAAPPPP